MESYICHWLWATIARLPFWIPWWQTIPKLYFWLSSCWNCGWQVDFEGWSSTEILDSSFIWFHSRVTCTIHTVSTKWLYLFQIVLPEGSTSPTAMVPFLVEQHLEVNVSKILLPGTWLRVLFSIDWKNITFHWFTTPLNQHYFISISSEEVLLSGCCGKDCGCTRKEKCSPWT